ncbi:MAG: hypothetical protein ACRD3W_17870 [Terriglobales bacterium]
MRARIDFFGTFDLMAKAATKRRLILPLLAAFALALSPLPFLSQPRAVPANGTEQRIFNFPSDFSIGTLYLVPDGDFPSTRRECPVSAACGKVTLAVPRRFWVMFEPNAKGYSHPQALDNIDGIEALRSPFYYLNDSECNMSAELLVHANHLKSLRVLLIDHSDISDKELERIANHPDLECVSANLC